GDREVAVDQPAIEVDELAQRVLDALHGGLTAPGVHGRDVTPDHRSAKMATVPPTLLVDRPSAVVPLAGTGVRRPGPGDRAPLVLVHDLTGEPAPLEAVARALPDDLPVLGLRSPLVGPRPERFTRVDALALRYLADLERAGTRGPLLVAGVGGCALLAVAMAARARRDGSEVGLCAAVDGGPGHLGPGHLGSWTARSEYRRRLV